MEKTQIIVNKAIWVSYLQRLKTVKYRTEKDLRVKYIYLAIFFTT